VTTFITPVLSLFEDKTSIYSKLSRWVFGHLHCILFLECASGFPVTFSIRPIQSSKRNFLEIQPSVSSYSALSGFVWSIFRNWFKQPIKYCYLKVNYKHKKIIKFIRAQRLRWFGHIERMQEKRMVKAIHSWKPISRRPIGRPKIRWEDDVRKDIQKSKMPNWKTLVQDRRRWKELFEKAKPLHKDYILVTNLMHWLLFIHKILFSSTCFEHQVLIFRRA